MLTADWFQTNGLNSLSLPDQIWIKLIQMYKIHISLLAVSAMIPTIQNFKSPMFNIFIVPDLKIF